MGRKARKDEIAALLSRLGEQVSHRIRFETEPLIYALQARALNDAREIAAELTTAVELFGAKEAQSKLLEISALLLSEQAFSNCDRLSFLLLDLEQELNSQGSSGSNAVFRTAALPSSQLGAIVAPRLSSSLRHRATSEVRQLIEQRLGRNKLNSACNQS